MPLNENAINEILPFATDGSVIEGDLMSLDEYIASNLRRKGHQTGVALRSVFNRQARQTSHIAAGVAQFIANQYPDGVVDDGDIDKVEAGLTAAIKKITKDPDIRKWPVDEPVYATPGQTDITPGFELDTVRDNVALFIDGLRQARGTYTYTATTITTKEPLAGGESLEVFSYDITLSNVAPLYTINNLSDVPDKAVAKNNLGISESPVGTIVPVLAADGYIPNGCLPCDANEYSRASFTEFYDNYLATGKLLTCTYGEYATQVALTGNCAKFAIDTVGRTFKTPLIKNGDSITQASSVAELGKSVKAGLPNLSGGFSNALGGKDASGWGCLTVTRDTNTYNVSSTTPGGLGYNGVNVDASQAGTHAIFGKSPTVTDEQIRLRHFVVVASSQMNNSAFNWSNYIAGLAGKANIDLSNVDLNVVLQPSMTGSATLNGTTDNTVQLTGIVTTLGLEVGDVIRIQYSGYDKLHSVESITNNSLIVVNYEHAGNRGNGSLKLANTTASVTVTRIAKWYNAPTGVGQGWVDVTPRRSLGTNYTNTTGRPIQILVQYQDNISGDGGIFKVGGLTRTTADLYGGDNYPYWFSAVIPNGDTYSISGGVTLPALWELR